MARYQKNYLKLPSRPRSGELTVSLEHTDNMANIVRYFMMMQEPGPLRELGYIAAKHLKRYVPYGETGNLRNKGYDVIVSENSVEVTWSGPSALPYAHYQYIGEIYNSNHAIFRRGAIAGWYSSAKPKEPSGRIMGHRRKIIGRKGKYKGKLLGYVEGYSHPRYSRNHWIEEVMNDDTTYRPMRYEMGRYLAEVVTSRWGGKYVGGNKFYKG